MACPAVAVEVAPIRGGADRAIVTDVTDPQYQAQIVEALAAALLEWKTDWETDPAHGGDGGGSHDSALPEDRVYRTASSSIAMAVVLVRLRERAHDRLLKGEDVAPTTAPAVAPAEQSDAAGGQ